MVSPSIQGFPDLLLVSQSAARPPQAHPINLTYTHAGDGTVFASFLDYMCSQIGIHVRRDAQSTSHRLCMDRPIKGTS